MSNKLALFQGVTTPVSDLAKAIQNQGWQLGIVKFDSKLNAFTAEAISPHGERLSKTGPDEATAVSNALLAVTRRNHMRSAAMYKVGMWRTNWHDRPREIAEAYRDAPIYDPKAVAAYKALGDDSMHRLHVLGGQLHIEPTNDPQPYKSADDMRKDIHEKRHYYLTQAGSAHPAWTAQQVAAFRAVHDILGHGVAGGHYDWPGRIQAANAHMPLLEPLAQQALFTEAVARPAFLHTYGAGPQKVALFPEFVDHHQDSNNPSAHRGIHPSQVTAPIAVADPFALAKVGAWGNTIDANKGWDSGIEPMSVNGYLHHGDPLQYKPTMDNAALIDTGWSKFQKGDGSEDRERMKLAIVNAFRVVLLSPRKDLRWNAIHYQDIAHIPGGVDDPKVYWDTLENARRKWNEKQGIDPESHMIYFKFLKPFEARIAANHPEKGWEWAKAEAKQVLFNWWTEEQERISEDDSKKPADKQRGADEIERRANEALARRLQLFLKPKDDKADVEDTQMSMFGAYEKPDFKTAAGGQYNLLTGQEGLKYGAFMGTHLKAISQVSQHADEILDAALEDVKNHDAEGHHFRHEVLKLGVSGVGPKVCSFAWLLLQPMTSQLATIDTHMMDVLGHNYDKEMNSRDYFKFEREFRAGLDAAGYSHMPLGAGQWGMWDYKRTGPGSHQDHSAMRVLDPKPHPEVDWVDKAVNLKGESWLKQAPDWWQNTEPAREAVAKEWDDTYGKSFAQNQIPYQDLGTQAMSKTAANSDEFHVSWGVPDDVLDKLHEWAADQGFEKPEKRSDLHMTALYLDKGYSDHTLHDWIKNTDAKAKFSDPSIDFFPSKENKGGVAVVVTFAGKEGKDTCERLIDEAEEKGKEVSRFPGGYKPHITVAYADSEPDESPTPPDITFEASGLAVSPPRSQTKTAYDHPFSYYWDRSMPVGASLESKARTLAEHAAADDLGQIEFREYIEDHKSDTRLSDEAFKRFKNKALRKFDRLSKVAGPDDLGRTPSFIHPETLIPYHGMPGQAMMEHARLQTGLSTQEVWRLLADEHVHKA